MSSTQVGSGAATQAAEPSTVPMRFEVTTPPVADVDRASIQFGEGTKTNTEPLP